MKIIKMSKKNLFWSKKIEKLDYRVSGRLLNLLIFVVFCFSWFHDTKTLRVEQTKYLGEFSSPYKQHNIYPQEHLFILISLIWLQIHK